MTEMQKGNVPPNFPEGWFFYKYRKDLSGFNPDHNAFYEHHAFHFFSKYFTPQRLRGKKVLDLGCGPGFYSVHAAKRGAIVTGVDKSRYLIGRANKNKMRRSAGNIRFICGNFLEVLTSLPAESFDIILAIDTIVSLSSRGFSNFKKGYKAFAYNRPHVEKVFKSVNRLLRRTGKMYIMEMHPCFGQGCLVDSRGQTVKLIRKKTTEDDLLSLNLRHYRARFKKSHEYVHFPTLEEISHLLCKSKLVITRIFEPLPSEQLKSEKPMFYQYSIRYPSMIVYEIQKA